MSGPRLAGARRPAAHGVREAADLGRVLAGMNVNIWDVNDTIQAIVRGARTVDTNRLANPGVPLELFLTA